MGIEPPRRRPMRLRSVMRRVPGESYQEFLLRLAQESGTETPTREQLAGWIGSDGRRAQPTFPIGSGAVSGGLVKPRSSMRYIGTGGR